MKTTTAIAIAVLLMSGAIEVHAVPVTVPTDLNLGDKYRLVFVTSTFRDATSTNIADYDAFVTSAANAVPELVALGTTWKVIGSTATDTVKDHTGTDPNTSVGVPIYRLDDVRIADDNADLWDGSIAASLQVNENGTLIGFAPVWTGTGNTGDTYNPPAFGALGGTNAMQGNPTSTTFHWIGNSTGPPSAQEWPLYAMSGELTVVPEPSALVMTGMGLAGLLAFGRGRRPEFRT